MRKRRRTKPMQTDATAGLTRQWPLRYPRVWQRTMDYQGGAADRHPVLRLNELTSRPTDSRILRSETEGRPAVP